MLARRREGPCGGVRPLLLISHARTDLEARIIHEACEGERKALHFRAVSPWAWVGPDMDRVPITEGVIDMLSAVALGTQRSLIGLPGCENWEPEWFKKLAGKDVILRVANAKDAAVLPGPQRRTQRQARVANPIPARRFIPSGLFMATLNDEKRSPPWILQVRRTLGYEADVEVSGRGRRA
jgi:hypothetical protein